MVEDYSVRLDPLPVFVLLDMGTEQARLKAVVE